ncbi:MAG: hypothetical protein PHT12_04425 [Patescibacteria group bacterium]|nr:hypothetical protein [Patescibacteria group bacterium]
MKTGIYNWCCTSGGHWARRATFVVKWASFGVLLWLLYTGRTIGENAFLYFFSSVAQSLLALVGVIGAVVVFRMQLIEMEAERCAERMTDELSIWSSKFTGTDKWAAIDVAQELDNSCRDEKTVASILNAARPHRLRLETLKIDKSDLRNNLVDFVLVTFITTASAFGCVLATQLFVRYPRLGTVAAMSVLMLVCYSLLFGWRVVKSVVGYSYAKTCTE